MWVAAPAKGMLWGDKNFEPEAIPGGAGGWGFLPTQVSTARATNPLEQGDLGSTLKHSPQKISLRKYYFPYYPHHPAYHLPGSLLIYSPCHIKSLPSWLLIY